MAADGNTVRPNVRGWNRAVRQESGTTSKAPELQGKGSRTKERCRYERIAVHRCLCDCRTELAFRLVDVARLGSLGERLPLFSILSSVCRSLAREHISFPHHRGPGWSEGRRHGAVRHCPPSHVYGHNSDVSDHAIGIGFSHLFSGYVGIHPSHRQADQQRRSRIGERT